MASLGRIEYWTANHSLGMNILEIEFKKLKEVCKASYPNEIGGILIGNYSKDLRVASILKVILATEDSISDKYTFVRGIKGLSKILNIFWSNKKYYLGEWHFHPNGVPSPSTVDITQMFRIAMDQKYHCPEPILIILGGRYLRRKLVIKEKVWIFSRNGTYSEQIRK